MNHFLKTFTVMPLTSGSRPAPFRLPIRFGEKNGFLLADQLRTADLERLRGRIGPIDKESLRAVLALLRDMFEED